MSKTYKIRIYSVVDVNNRHFPAITELYEGCTNFSYDDTWLQFDHGDSHIYIRPGASMVEIIEVRG
jgi:hypothetical protein